MIVNTDSYDELIKQIKECVVPIELKSISEKRFIILGSNMTDKLEKLIRRLVLYNKDFSCIYVGKKSQIENMSKDLLGRISILEWNKSYGLELVKYIYSNVALKLNGMMFLGALDINLRDLNIMEMGNGLKEYYGKEFSVYGYIGEEEFYEYQKINKYLLGLKIYKDMNTFFSL